MDDNRKNIDDEELRQRLTPEQYQITRRKGTERAFTGEYHDHHGEGEYCCVVCGQPLFASESKYDSGSGWPSFYQPKVDDNVETSDDFGLGMKRTEVVCSSCKSHLGHVFPDGPEPTGLRYCINSGALSFRDEEDGDSGE